NLGMISLNETEVTKKLAAWAAIIAIPTLIAGIYGMNFKNMPEYDLAYGYPLSLALMIGADIALFFWFKRIRWL
ncbi:MAG TPA: CorA family divalent cation transporter, partial [Casimicrobiaceae bacterium]|nr:CorA family divalent cation transporter [Casimicrobiaceae bacterium]